MRTRRQALPVAMVASAAAMTIPMTAWSPPVSGGMGPGMMGQP